MAAITLDSRDGRIAREAALSRRVMRWAIAGSLVVHLTALAAFSAVHLAPLSLAAEPRLIEVRLVESPPLAVVTHRALAEPHTVVAPKPPPAARPQPTTRAARTSPSPGRTARVGPPSSRPAGAGAPAPAMLPDVPHPAVSPRAASPEPPPRARRPQATEPAAPQTPSAPVGLSPASSSGAGTAAAGAENIGLGSGSRQGDIPGAVGGGTGVAPRSGGPGSGSGPGRGAGSGAGTGSAAGTGPGAGGSGAGGSGGAGGGAGGGGGHVSRLADRETPSLVRRVDPVYPVSAQVEGIQGAVKLLVTVTRQGKVGAVKVVSSSGDSRLDGAAVNAVKQWRYRPAVQDGIARDVGTYAVVTFSLE